LAKIFAAMVEGNGSSVHHSPATGFPTDEKSRVDKLAEADLLQLDT